jgi:TPR repeat protein
MYFLGKGVTKNYDYAKYWLKKAAAQDYAPAQETLKKLGW